MACTALCATLTAWEPRSAGSANGERAGACGSHSAVQGHPDGGAAHVAPARWPLTAVHITRDGTRTLCGRPMDPDGLWQPVDGPDPACKACTLMAARQSPRTE